MKTVKCQNDQHHINDCISDLTYGALLERILQRLEEHAENG